MTETMDDFRSLAKVAVRGDDNAWAELVADDPERLDMWLTDTVIDIQNQLAEKRTSWEEYKTSGHHAYADFKEEEGAYYKWRKAALRFKQSCEARKRELRLAVRRRNVTATDQKRAGRIDDIAARAQEQRDHAIESLADLASLVESFVSGSASAEDLDAALDDLTVVRKRGGTITLRELLAAVRRNHGEEQGA